MPGTNHGGGGPWGARGSIGGGNGGAGDDGGAGSWGRGGPTGGPQGPDIEDLLRRGQDRIRGFLPGNLGGKGIFFVFFVRFLVSRAFGTYLDQLGSKNAADCSR